MLVSSSVRAVLQMLNAAALAWDVRKKSEQIVYVPLIVGSCRWCLRIEPLFDGFCTDCLNRRIQFIQCCERSSR